MRCQLVTQRGELAALEPAWWDLFQRCLNATPFSAPAWLLPWWDTFGPGALRTVAVWHGDRLVGLAPLYIEDGAYGCRLLPLGIGLSDHTDVLIDSTEAGVGETLLDALAELPNEWEHWSAEELRAESALLGLDVGPGWVTDDAQHSACPVLTLGASLQDSVPSRQLRKWRMAENRAERRGRERRPTSVDTLSDDLAILFRLHGARWQSRGEAGVLADDPVQQFHQRAAPQLLAAGLLRMELLFIEDTAAGAYYGLQHGARAYAYLGGFDPVFTFESPGTVLLGAALQGALADGCREFSFLRGQEAYKYAWGAQDQWNQRRTFRLSR